MKNKGNLIYRKERGISTMKEDLKIIENFIKKYKNNPQIMIQEENFNLMQSLENLIARNKKLENITKLYNSYCVEAPENAQYNIIIADKRYFDMGIFEEQFIPKSKVIEIIENYYNEHDDTKEEITKFIEKLLQEGDK